MISFPHTRLFLGPSYSLLVSGPHILVIDTQAGTVLNSTAALEGPEKDALLKTGPIRHCAVDEGLKHIATTGDDKKLKVWQIDGLKLLSERELPKKPTGIRFTRDGQTILVSDKFGDVFSYTLHPDPNIAPPSLYVGSSKRGALTSHENPSNGRLILGHASLLTSFVLTSDEQYIITADRDEHIRVSWYPKGFVIERYCLGHEKFVSAIHIPSFAPSVLVSGGGDPMLKLWDWMSGSLLSEIPILNTLEPYIKVKAPKAKGNREDGDDEDGGDAQRNIGRKKKGRKGKGKADEKNQTTNAGEDQSPQDAEPSSVPPEDSANHQTRSGTDTPIDLEAAESQNTDEAVPEERTTLVLHKIDSVDLTSRGHGRYLIFSAIGATALCFCAFPDDKTPSPPPVRIVDLGRPIVEFTLDSENRVWVFLDPNWNSTEASGGGAVRLLSWVDGELTEVEGADVPPLLSAVRSSTLPATAEDLKTLDIYSALATMPKNVDPEHDSMKRDNLSDALVEPEAEKQLTQRELARLKKKRALALKVQGENAPDAVEDNERSGKKLKSEDEGQEGTASGDVANDMVIDQP